MTEQQIKRCIELDRIREDYNRALDTLSNNEARIVIGWHPNNCSHLVYNSISYVDSDSYELLPVVENFIRDK